MTLRRLIWACALSAGCAGATAFADGPANVPPDAGDGFVDAQGCAWQRVDIAGLVTWAAVIGADGTQVCDGARALSTDGEGTTEDPTEVTAPGPARAPRFPTGGYHIQVGAYRMAENADDVIVQLQGEMFDVLQQRRPRRDGSLRIIYVGPFPDQTAARVARNRVRALGFRDAFVWVP